MTKKLSCIAALCAGLVASTALPRVRADDVWLRFDNAPAGGLVIAEVDLTAAVQWCGVPAVVPEGIAAAPDSGVVLQFIPDADFDPQRRARGVVVARVPDGRAAVVKLMFTSTGPELASADGTVETGDFQIVHDPAKQGGLPSRIVLRQTGKSLESIRWQDRLYQPELGGFRLADDAHPRVTRIADGPLCTAVRVAAKFARAGGGQPESKPDAVYHWIYLRDQPLAYISVVQRQQQPFAWRESHFLELHQSGDELPQWAGSEPPQSGTFQGEKASRAFSDWAAMHDGRNAVAVLRSGRMLIYDGKGGYGAYVHAHGSHSWETWSGVEQRLAAWLWIGSSDDPVTSVRQAAERLPAQGGVVVTVGAVRERLTAARAELAELTGDAQRQARLRLGVAERLESLGRFADALAVADGQQPDRLRMLAAGDLGLLFEQADAGISLVQLLDAAADVQLLATRSPPLFTLTLRRAGQTDDVRVTADAAWRRTQLEPSDDGRLRLVWSGATPNGLESLRVECTAAPDHAASAVRWTLRAEAPAGWAWRQVVFPQVAVADLGADGVVVFPRGPGEAHRDLWRRAYHYAGRYPNGWTTMQWLAAYDEARRTGLYVGMHDPGAATKEITVHSQPADRAVALTFEHWAPGMDGSATAAGAAASDDGSVVFELPGEAVWHVLRGDWFDAAMIYRQWASQHAKWWPTTGQEGRADTPQWMRELPAWALASGDAANVVPQVKRFAEALGVPVGVHWYNWHQIPFDNDYPHYFPTRDGFAAGVAELQQGSVYVMPYINGRLWDTRDRGLEDFEFTSVARPAATKDEPGEPYLETYSSKETDGSPVRLAAMCPTTEVWRSKQAEIVGRLMNQCGVKGVYIDQVAAAKPALCFDRSHGHPTGGGDWWTAGYWELLKRIRQDMPADRMLTTECNAEPYAHVFDGYLTWHWQHDGQVPAFPAIYGGMLQMFGRAYRGGPTQDLALRMKAGQQLVFGEQIGWLDPSVVDQTENFRFFRQVVRLRWQLKRYFYAGRMARPPRLIGSIPRVTADWQWHGEWPVTTDALLAGAWSLADEDRLVLLFANVDDAPLSVACDFDAAQYDLTGQTLAIQQLAADAAGPEWTAPRKFRRELTIPGRTALAWELRGGR